MRQATSLPAMKRDRLSIIVNVVVLVVVAYALLRPSGPLGARLAEWNRERRRDRILATSWVNSGGRKSSRLLLGADCALSWSSPDYECPYCRQQHTVLSASIAAGRSQGVAFRHLPLAIHPRARGAALAAICADRVGRFVPMHERLFTTTTWIADTNWVREALASGVTDTATFTACMRGRSAQERLRATWHSQGTWESRARQPSLVRMSTMKAYFQNPRP
ncbi:MAG: thioredoxin domain-containing protein [Gemmatimonadetes bacterium]|nr:thioredoxin domain-containing protein [Gemmatimonadota bacterium]